MATSTIPQICLPYVLTTAGGPHLRVVLASPAKTLNVTLNGSFWNDGRTGTSGNLLKALVDGLNAAELAGTPSGGTWNNSADSGQHTYLLQRDGGAGDSATNIQFPSSELPADALGFTGTTTPTSDAAGVTKWQAGRVSGRQWLARPTTQTLQTFFDIRRQDIVVTTEGMDGTVGTRDRWGSRERVVMEISSVPAAAVLDWYTDDADYALAAGAVQGEAHFSLEALRQAWLDLGADYAARLWPDYTTLGTYYEVQCGREDKWIGDLSEALIEERRQPLWFTVRLTFNKVA